MQGNDLSNGTPSLVMVHIDLLTTKQEQEFKKWGRKKTRDVITLNEQVAMALYQASFKIDATLECFSTDGSSLEKWEEILDYQGVAPFRYYTVYESPQEVVARAPYRPNLVGICDAPNRGLMYGSYYMDFARLFPR